jgi:hypothetical protein
MRPIGIVANSPQDVAAALNDLAGGRGNNGCTVTLTANAATTTVTSPSVRGLAPLDCLHFDPLTANAAAELAAGTMYVLEANRTANQIVITHANNAQTDRKFRLNWFATQ